MDVTNWKNVRLFIKKDFEVSHGEFKYISFFKALLFEAGFKYVFWLRITRYFYLRKRMNLIRFAISRCILKHYSYKYGFDISYRTEIEKGFSIAHFGSIIISAERIGDNCCVRPGVVIGGKLSEAGLPTIGNNVQFGVGCKALGRINIGNNVIIGANAVITHDIEDNCVVAGIPARVIRKRGDEN